MLAERMFNVAGNVLSGLTGLEAQDISHQLQNGIECPSMIERTRVSLVEPSPKTITLGDDGYPVSSNPTWNQCVRGKATLEDLRNNPDMYTTRSGKVIHRSCDVYRNSGSNDWKFPDDEFVTFTIMDPETGNPPMVTASRGYVVVQPLQQQTAAVTNESASAQETAVQAQETPQTTDSSALLTR